MKPRIIFRADGNSQIGLGHVVRSLALVHMLQDNFRCYFAIQNSSPDIINQIRLYGAVPIVLPENTNFQSDAIYLTQQVLTADDIVVLDGYNFNFEYQQIIKQATVSLVCIDDIQADSFLADVVINQTGGINPINYQVQPNTQLCLGPAFALLREPFLKAAVQPRSVATIKKIMLNMGGADPENHTFRILAQIIPYYSDLSLNVVIGSAFSHQEALQELLRVNTNITLHQNLTAEAMCRLMQSCDAAILPPSSVSYEWCSVSGPLFLHQIADNQQYMHAFLLENQLAFSLADLPAILNNPDQTNLIAAQIQKQKSWFNGQSRQKLRAVFNKLYYQKHLGLRPVTEADTMLLFDRANDPEVRRNSFNTEPIPLEIHQIWLQNKLRDPGCVFYIAEVNKLPAGMIRFDIQGNTATISYLLDKSFRGKGIGTLLLQKGLEALKKQKPAVTKAVGYIQESNLASIAAFKKNNFAPDYTLPLIQPGSLVFAKSLK